MAGVQTGCSVLAGADVRVSKTGLEGEALHLIPTLMELIGLKGCRTDVCCDYCSTAQKRVQSEVEGKCRELSSNGTCPTWCRFGFRKNSCGKEKPESADCTAFLEEDQAVRKLRKRCSRQSRKA